ncbi:hypothetical protein ALC57_09626 [Trachymyrmex cornetzi]|uniref:Uncharacterized protein n=1 Tax=Trachymyrmex cornetzi TaxID=471704 RepID=A0A195DZ62_9HYME|nr:hypothetical protein ALC57_09626 [Trachymyrmex cornetzi]
MFVSYGETTVRCPNRYCCESLRVRDYLHGRRARMAAIIVTLNRIQHVPFYVNRIDSSAAQEYNENFCGRYKYSMCNNDTNSSKLIALRNTRDERDNEHTPDNL